jgi:hypothetical protein
MAIYLSALERSATKNFQLKCSPSLEQNYKRAVGKNQSSRLKISMFTFLVIIPTEENLPLISNLGPIEQTLNFSLTRIFPI